MPPKVPSSRHRDLGMSIGPCVRIETRQRNSQRQMATLNSTSRTDARIVVVALSTRKAPLALWKRATRAKHP